MHPGALQIGAQLHQFLSLLRPQRQRPLGGESGYLTFEPAHRLERLVPAPLQLCSNQSIGGIDGIILAAGVRCGELRLGKRQLELLLSG